MRRRTSALCGKCAGGYGAQLLYTSSLADFESFMDFLPKYWFLLLKIRASVGKRTSKLGKGFSFNFLLFVQSLKLTFYFWSSGTAQTSKSFFRYFSPFIKAINSTFKKINFFELLFHCDLKTFMIFPLFEHY